MTKNSTIEFRTKAPLRYRIGNKGRIGLACLSCAALVSTGAALAYLTDTDSAVNTFSIVGALDIDLTEPQWDSLDDGDNDGIPDAAEELSPLQSVVKDPRVTNTAGTEAWTFLKVQVPTYDVKTVSTDGKSLSESTLQEIFTYKVASTWAEIGQATYSAESHMTTHVYAYKSALPVNSTSDPLFTSVTLINLADDQLESLATSNTISLSIPIDAYGIQTQGFATYEDAWPALNA